jgi:hypothetical protein
MHPISFLWVMRLLSQDITSKDRCKTKAQQAQTKELEGHANFSGSKSYASDETTSDEGASDKGTADEEESSSVEGR